MNFPMIVDAIKALAARAKELAPPEVGAEIDGLESQAHDAVMQTQQNAMAAIADASKTAAPAEATPPPLLSAVATVVEVTVEGFVRSTLTPMFGSAAASAAETYVRGGEAAILAKLQV